MKIAILTFHNSLNHGAALQAYALQAAVRGMGVECEIIDYENRCRKLINSMWSHSLSALKDRDLYEAGKYCAGAIVSHRRKRRFTAFYKKHLVLTSNLYTTSEGAKALNSEYDKFIVGSDQVWNYKNNGSDLAYLLDFVQDDRKKASYSSSFGLETIPEHLERSYSYLLNRIKHISTREQHGVHLIEKLTGRKAEIVLDPVFLLSKYHWLSLCGEEKRRRKYIFCYTNRPNQWHEFIERTGCSTAGFNVYKLTRYLTAKDVYHPHVRIRYSLSPTDFVATVASADLVVTASFHCIAMSIILEIPFVAVLTGDMGLDARVLNILQIAGLEDRLLSNIDKPACFKKIDFEIVNSRIDEYRKRSMEFLKGAIFS